MYLNRDDKKIAGYASKGPETILINWLGLMIVAFGALVVYLVANPR